MTNEEAIKIISQIIKDEEGFLFDNTVEAHKMAIKALETIPKYKDAYGKGWDDGARATYEHLKMCEEEQEPCEDAISRQAVLDLLFNSYIKTELTSIGNASKEYAELCVDELNDLPSVNPQEPKTDVLYKIRAEIEQTTSRYTISRERGARGQVEWSDRLIKESEVLAILDKYKAESEE